MMETMNDVLRDAWHWFERHARTNPPVKPDEVQIQPPLKTGSARQISSRGRGIPLPPSSGKTREAP
jgi:hypothetical protein